MTVLGLHPNTTDQAVIRYLEAHGKVNRSDKVIHHVFPGTPGSTLCAGKLNGNRSYVMDIKTPMGSFHIIDGEKVTIRYNGQEWTCARCHQLKRLCPGRAIAWDCTAERVLLSSHMEAHWQKIGFKPETEADSEVDILPEVDIQVGHTRKEKPVLPESKFQNRYKSVIVKGFLPDTSLDDALKVICEKGFLSDIDRDSVIRNEKSGVFTISNLVPDQCLSVMENMHAKKFLGRKIFVTSIVENSPKKTSPGTTETTSGTSAPLATGNPVISDSNKSKTNSEILPQISSPILDPRAASLLAASKNRSCQSVGLEEFEFASPIKGFVNNGHDKNSKFDDMIELPNKRKASISPEGKELTRKEKKAAKKDLKFKNKTEQKARMQLEVTPPNN